MKSVCRRGLLLLAVSTLLLVAGTQCSNAQAVPRYGTKVKFMRGVALRFPDFTLTYVGSRNVASQHFKPGFTYEDFVLVKGEQKVKVSWSAGTGDIGPAWFEIAGKGYQIELRSADDFGWLKDDELVIKAKPR